MSAVLVATGAVKAGQCPTCGTPVTLVEYVGPGGPFSVIQVRHSAPCGLPCYSGGVPLSLVRNAEVSKVAMAKLVHRWKGEPCALCDKEG